MRVNKFLILGIVLTLILSGCGNKTITVRETAYLNVTCPSPPSVRVISTAPVRPQAIKDLAGVYWVGFSPNGYQNLSLNVQESIRFIKGQKVQIDYYRSCVVDFNEGIDKLKRKADN